MGQGVATSCGVGRRRGLDLALLWPWCRLTATDLIRPLAWEPPYAMGVAPKRKEKIYIYIISINRHPCQSNTFVDSTHSLATDIRVLQISMKAFYDNQLVT